ncbi:hypothetical protein ACHAQH_008669 [Verticillium albo-atrum]
MPPYQATVADDPEAPAFKPLSIFAEMKKPDDTIKKATTKTYQKHQKPAHQTHKQKVVAAKKRHAQAAHERKNGTRSHVTSLDLREKHSATFCVDYATGFCDAERSPRKLGFSKKNWKLYQYNMPLIKLRKEKEQAEKALKLKAKIQKLISEE